MAYGAAQLPVSVFTVKRYSFGLVCFVSLFRAVKIPKMNALAVKSYFGDVFSNSFMKPNTFKAASVVFRDVFIVLVLASGCLPKIFNKVVRFVSVNMIYLFRASTMLSHKYNPVKFVHYTFNLYLPVPVDSIDGANPIATFNFSGALKGFNINKWLRLTGIAI